MNKSQFTLLLFLSFIIISGCATGQKRSEHTLSAVEFRDQINGEEHLVLDVRTPEEFSKGHLENAININWNDDGFDEKISNLDKSKPVYIYCLSGGRSHEAAEKMRSDGFTSIYEMEGGIMKWRSAGLPEATTGKKESGGMSMSEYEAMLVSDKLVLVDFYAPWCGPCRKMKPYLDEIENEMSDKVKVIRIDIDKNPGLTRSLRITSIPVLHIYEKNDLVWENVGYISKKEVVKKLK